MRRIRIIPVLLIHKGGLYKSVKFKDYKYVGDPINAVKIFNEKEVDEIVILDIDATAYKREPDFKQITQIAGEAFMPLAYGGGITKIDQVKKILYEGVEKVIFNKAAVDDISLLNKTAKQFGSSSVVASIDVKKDWLGRYKVYTNNGKIKAGLHPSEFAKTLEENGVGEIFLNSIDNDGTFGGYDLQLISSITSAVNIPVIACGGAGSLNDFYDVIKIAGASAAAAGSFFVFKRPHRAVLVTYPGQEDLFKEVYSKL
jgi:cyclase